MTRDRTIQLIAVMVLLVTTVASGAMLPSLLRLSEDRGLRYTNVSVEGAPPWVAIGSAVGALRGIVVDFLWMKVNWMKERGLFFEVMSDSELITKLQPRFPAVWTFHGHNMAYNISVATQTQEDRWEWVNAGIRLVREQGLKYNPNDIELHKDLAFWLGHKIDGYTDEAHLFYKERFCREWHYLLGQPPEGFPEKVAWIKEVADAPESLQMAIRIEPTVRTLLDRLAGAMPDGSTERWTELNRDFLERYETYQNVTQYSEAARVLGTREQMEQTMGEFALYERIAGDPELQDAWKVLIAHARKRILKDEYNMDPQLMYEFTRDVGPLDWRHPQAHALYFARRGIQFSQGRIAEYDLPREINADRLQTQAVQALSRTGRITYDPLYGEFPSRFPQPAFVDTIVGRGDEPGMFEEMYVKYFDARGAGGDTFINFFQNYLAAEVVFWFRSGERARAQQLLDILAEYFIDGMQVGVGKRIDYKQPVESFCKEVVFDQLQQNPHLAPQEVVASLRYGLIIGVGQDRPDVFKDAIAFARDVTDYYKGNDFYDFVNQFGRARMADLVHSMEDSLIIAFLQVMTDPTVRIEDRMSIWSQIDEYEPSLRALTYDRVMPTLEQQYARNPLAQAIPLTEAFPAPPGLDAKRAELATLRARRQQEVETARQRDNVERRGSGG